MPESHDEIKFTFPASSALLALALSTEVRIGKAVRKITKSNLTDEERTKIIQMEKQLSSLTEDFSLRLNKVFADAGIDKTLITKKG